MKQSTSPLYDEAAVRQQAKLLHTLAKGIDGVIVVTAYGEDPATGAKLVPFVRHLRVGDVEGTVTAVMAQEARPHSNVYVPWAVMRHGLGPDERGGKADIMAVLALVADLDADHASKPKPSPLAPSLVIESSPGNSQAVFIPERPLTPAEAEPLAKALRAATAADTGTGDVAHVWRMAGALNWPNAVKVKRGRPTTPAKVHVVQTWNGSPISVPALQAALAPFAAAVASRSARLLPPPEDETPITLASLPPQLADLIEYGAPKGGRSEGFFKVVSALHRRGHSHFAIGDLLEEHPDGIAEKYRGRVHDEVARVCLKGQEAAAVYFKPPAPPPVEPVAGGDAELFPPLNSAAIALIEDEVAVQFAEEHRGRLRFCFSHGSWFVWDGNRWRRDETQRAFHWARELARRLGRDEHEKVRIQFGKMAFAAAVERGARTDLAVTAEMWDADPFLLATPGGTVDLRTGKIRPADPAEGITKVTTVAPADHAFCPLWLRFLEEATGGDVELIRFIQQWCGYCLTGDTREHALVFLFGGGGNGKSVLVNVFLGVMGDYAATAAMDAFVASKFDRHSTDLAMLRGARLVTASETEEGRFWAESRIKQITGGDPITARFMRRDFFTYNPTFKLTIVGNHKPGLRGVDDAAKRRFNLVPFTRTPAVRDMRLEQKLRAEWPGILRWMIDGCLDWQQNGLVRPRLVEQSTAEYFADQDLFAAWLEERCTTGADLKAPTADLFASWALFAKTANAEIGTANTFTDRLKAKGFVPLKNVPKLTGGRARGFAGVAPQAASQPDEAP